MKMNGAPPRPDEFERPLPADLVGERFLLGSVLLDGTRFPDLAGSLKKNDFSLESHRRIFHRMNSLQERGEKIDHHTVAMELNRFGELESVGGISYIVSLDEGMPQIPNLDAYIRSVQEKAHLCRLATIGQHLMNRAMSGSELPTDIIRATEEQILGIHTERDDAGLISAGDFLRDFPGGFQSFIEPEMRGAGIKTGFEGFDEVTNGLRRGEMSIVGARPGVGKSVLACNIVWHAAVNQGVPVAVYSLEMSKESLLLRMLCAAARIDSQRLRGGFLTSEERSKIRNAANLMADAPIYIDDSSSTGLMDVHAGVKRIEREEKTKVGLVVVDYLQLMEGRAKEENRNQEVGRISRGLKLMSKNDQLDCHVLALSQLGRESEKRKGDLRPQLSDLRESGSLEQDADIVSFIFREEMYRPDREDLRGMAELILRKNRGGPLTTVNLIWLASMQRFTSAASNDTWEDGRLPYGDN